MKITNKQAEDLGFNIISIKEAILDSDYLFDFKTNELWFINDGFGDPELIVKIKNFEHLKQVIETFGYDPL